MQGAGEAPPLTGAGFMAAWGNRSTEEFYNLIKSSMPYGNGNSLDAATYRSITAYVLAANGAKPGNNVLVGNEAVHIAAIADGKMPAATQAPARPHSCAKAGPLRAGQTPTRAGRAAARPSASDVD